MGGVIKPYYFLFDRYTLPEVTRAMIRNPLQKRGNIMGSFFLKETLGCFGLPLRGQSFSRIFMVLVGVDQPFMPTVGAAKTI